MRTLESRLRELVESTEYQKDFKEFKKSILELREEKFFKGKKLSSPFIISGKSFFRFIKIDLEKSRETGTINRDFIPLKEVQSLLRKGNINDRYIEIPPVYPDFKVKHGLEYFFDPGKPYPQEFNPFHDSSLVAQPPGDGGTKIPMTVDISYPSRILERKFKAAVKSLKEMWKIKDGRKERYSDDEIYRVKKLLQKGLKGIQIFKTMNPKHKSFNPRDDYIFLPEDEVIDGEKVSYKTDENKDGWKKYIRTLRLVQRVKKRNLDIQLR